jgi:hypothetical protein
MIWQHWHSKKGQPMIDYIIVGLVSGLMVFIALFLVSLLTLGLISGFIHLILVGFHGFRVGESSVYGQQTT